MNALGDLWALDVAAFMICAVACGMFKPESVWHNRLVLLLFILGYAWMIPLMIAAIVIPIVRYLKH